MRYLLFIILFPVLPWTGCRGAADQVADFIPGTYVNSAQGEFGVARDTLLIRLESEGHYRMERRTAYRARRDGKLLPEKRRVKVYETVYDPGRLLLSEPVSGRVFRFDRARGALLLNRAVYRKL